MQPVLLDGLKIVADYRSGYVRIWDVASGNCIQLEHKRQQSNMSQLPQSRLIGTDRGGILIVTGGDSMHMYQTEADPSEFEKECRKVKTAAKVEDTKKLFMARQAAIALERSKDEVHCIIQ